MLANSDAARDRVRVLATQVADPKLNAVLDAVAREAPPEELAELVETCVVEQAKATSPTPKGQP